MTSNEIAKYALYAGIMLTLIHLYNRAKAWGSLEEALKHYPDLPGDVQVTVGPPTIIARS